ncbi:conserved hypothetical protein [Mesorhizobium plurifarium]|uniref:Uncharacterized protein n=1 Tax=Mesorhizobium plurifarium TaxID=69974 RepID=A0A090GT14_MESPL|nr:AAA family ATPase [Mesorhizobium sp. LCM 4577]CDX51808.1 conserved hypothetical protein [Mesorhizobium plurifarium]
MIVEFVGPAGSGKTTIAHALCHHLRAHGHPASVVLTYRPGGYQSMLDPGGIIPAIHRVARAIAGPISMACRPVTNAADFRVSTRLMNTLPPQNLIWRIRLAQYVLRLARAWRQSIGCEDILIFDQAFVQVVSTLALLSGSANEKSLANALDIVPTADIVVRINACEGLRIERLRDRQRRQSFAERLFEAKLEANLRSAQTVDQVCGLLKARGRSIVDVDTSRRLSPTLALDDIEEQIFEALWRAG